METDSYQVFDNFNALLLNSEHYEHTDVDVYNVIDVMNKFTEEFMSLTTLKTFRMLLKNNYENDIDIFFNRIMLYPSYSLLYRNNIDKISKFNGIVKKMSSTKSSFKEMIILSKMSRCIGTNFITDTIGKTNEQ